jgi:hypothetical protein
MSMVTAEGSVTAEWSAFDSVSHVLNSILDGVGAAPTTASAAAASGSGMVSEALIALGSALSTFVNQTRGDVRQDIEGIATVRRYYQQNETALKYVAIIERNQLGELVDSELAGVCRAPLPPAPLGGQRLEPMPQGGTRVLGRSDAVGSLPPSLRQGANR